MSFSQTQLETWRSQGVKRSTPLLKNYHMQYWKQFSNKVNTEASLLSIRSLMGERLNFHVLVLMMYVSKYKNQRAFNQICNVFRFCVNKSKFSNIFKQANITLAFKISPRRAIVIWVFNPSAIWEIGEQAADNSQAFGALLTSFSKAFDCLRRMLLIAKLNAHEFRRKALKIMNSFQGNQRTKTNNSLSSWEQFFFLERLKIQC